MALLSLSVDIQFLCSNLNISWMIFVKYYVQTTKGRLVFILGVMAQAILELGVKKTIITPVDAQEFLSCCSTNGQIGIDFWGLDLKVHFRN